MELIDEKWLLDEFNSEKNKGINLKELTYSSVEKV